MSSETAPTRLRVLNAAWHLLEQGGSTVRMSDIAKKAGISRQALYLHFPNRADLLLATTRHIDEVKHVDDRLAPSRAAQNGQARLRLYVEAWGNYIPEIHGVATALMAMQATDAEAAKAWEDRMQAVRHGCAAVVHALDADGDLTTTLSPERATDLLWALLSVPTWEQLRVQCDWSQDQYLTHIERTAALALTGEE
ncbi:MAG: TetR/AcrR family transcriptional regulator [Thalassovita sp.]